MILSHTNTTVTVSLPLIDEGEAFDGSITMLTANINYVIKHLYNNEITVTVSYLDKEFVAYCQPAAEENNQVADTLVSELATIINNYQLGE